MEMLEERSWLVDCREETQEERAEAIRIKLSNTRPRLRSNCPLRSMMSILCLISLKGVPCEFPAGAATSAF